MAVQLTCPSCGYVGRYKTRALGEYHLGRRHSCERHRERLAAAQREAERKANRRSGVVRDCRHPIARHRHGTRQAYVLDRCRCLPCRDAANAYQQRRTRLKAYGRIDRVDAHPVREHIQALSAAGVGLRTITEHTGLSGGQLCSIIYGRGRRGTIPRRPQRTVTSAVRDRIMALDPADPRLLASGARVDATGTHRRVQALVTVGWSQALIAEAIGMNRGNFFKLMLADEVTVRTAKAVREVYDAWWDQAPPSATHRQKISVARSRRHAAERGWLPPLAWDDESIDDPAARPLDQVVDEPVGLDEIAVERIMAGTLRLPPYEQSPELDEAVARLAARGLSDRQIGERVGRGRDAVLKLRERRGIPSGAAA